MDGCGGWHTCNSILQMLFITHLFIALHMMYDRMAPLLPINAPTCTQQPMCSTFLKRYT